MLLLEDISSAGVRCRCRQSQPSPRKRGKEQPRDRNGLWLARISGSELDMPPGYDAPNNIVQHV